MKKSIIYLAASMIFAVSCDNINDIQEEEGRAPYTKNLTITLTEDDYASIAATAYNDALASDNVADTIYAQNVETDGAFNTFVTANDYVPALLHNLYPALEIGSVIKATYNTTVKPEGLAQYEAAAKYTVSSEDYTAIGGLVETNESFSSATPASANIPTILASVYTEAVEGDAVGVTYNYAVTPMTSSDVETTKNNDMYIYDGAVWAEADVIMLDAADYDAMGAPGKYDNFSSSARPENYLPQYLSQTLPYAQEGDEETIVYAYYGANTSFGADVYTYTDGAWSSISVINCTQETAQFFYASKGWVFDPTVRFAMAKEDYQIMVDWVRANITNGIDYSPYDDSEYYFGNSANYSNIDTRISKRSTEDYEVPLTDEEKATYGIESWSDDTEKSIAITFDRIKYRSIPALLGEKYPEATTHVSGVEQTYEVSFKSYENDASSNVYTYKYKCTQDAPNAAFEFVSDITE